MTTEVQSPGQPMTGIYVSCDRQPRMPTRPQVLAQLTRSNNMRNFDSGQGDGMTAKGADLKSVAASTSSVTSSPSSSSLPEPRCATNRIVAIRFSIAAAECLVFSLFLSSWWGPAFPERVRVGYTLDVPLRALK